MKTPLYVRTLTQPERSELEAGLRSKNAFVVRRCQILLARQQGCKPSEIAHRLGCAVQTVRNALHAFALHDMDALTQGSSRPKSVQPVLSAGHLEQIQAILHHSPRLYDKNRSTWTLELLAEVVFEKGLSSSRLSIETIRQALQRLGTHWKRAKQWITSPDPAYERKKNDVTA